MLIDCGEPFAAIQLNLTGDPESGRIAVAVFRTIVTVCAD